MNPLENSDESTGWSEDLKIGKDVASRHLKFLTGGLSVPKRVYSAHNVLRLNSSMYIVPRSLEKVFRVIFIPTV